MASTAQKLKVDLSHLPRVTNPTFFPLYMNKSRYLVLKGGGSSGKSVFVSQKLIFRCLTERGHKFLVIRKVKQDIRDSAFAQLVSTIRAWGMDDLFHIPSGRSSDLYLKCKLNGNEFIFCGLDDVERLKSIEGITSIWIEEASELTPEDFRQLNIRMRGRSRHYKQMILSFNPISITHWLKKEFFDQHKENATVHESTYRDNIFLPDEDRKVLEGFRDTDEYYYMVYCLGQWGVTGKTVYDGQKVTERLLQVREIPPLATGTLLYRLDDAERIVPESITFSEDKNGPIRIYEWPTRGNPYVIGGDPAEGGEDYCASSVRNNATWNQAATYRMQTDTDLYAKDMYALGMFYNRALIGIEVNFDSHPVKELTRLKYPKQYVRQKLDKIGKDVEEKFGWLTNKVTRPMLIGEHVALARDHIDTFNDIATLEEMLTFIRNDRGRPEAQEGAHDDTIFADGIALQIREQQRFDIEKPKEKPKPLPWPLQDEEPAAGGARSWKKW